MASLTVFSSAGDGNVRNSGTDYSTVVNAATGTEFDYTSGTTLIRVDKDGSGNLGIDRGFLMFDTSSLPNNATVTAATLSVYGYGKAETADGGVALSLVVGTPASNTSLSTADYDQVGSTEFATAIAYASFTVEVYNAFTLNASGIANISLVGFSNFALREAYDLAGTGPSATGNRAFTIYTSETTGTSKDPKLVITYTIPTTTSTTSSTSRTTTTTSRTTSTTRSTSTSVSQSVTTSTSSSTSTTRSTSTTVTTSSTSNTTTSTSTTATSTTSTSSTTTLDLSISIQQV